jgi:hypothetical protein
MMTIYLAGPISCLPDANRPAFEAERRRILALGLMDAAVVIPHELYQPVGPALECPALCWCEAMCVCLPAVERAAMVFLVPGWQASSGACREREHAKARGIPVCELAP